MSRKKKLAAMLGVTRTAGNSGGGGGSGNGGAASSAATTTASSGGASRQPQAPPPASSATSITPCRHGLLSKCDDCTVRGCGWCKKSGNFVPFCQRMCTSRANRMQDEWRCVLCREVACCTGLRSCCHICRTCERNIALRTPCEVCCEDFIPRHVRQLSCHHDRQVCSSCIRQTIRVAIQGASLCVLCPSGCGHQLSQEEIRVFIDADLAPLYAARIKEMHSARLRTICDKDSMEWAVLHTKQCPNCCVLMEKNEGCLHMCCRVCGHHFQWNETPFVSKSMFSSTVSGRDRKPPPLTAAESAVAHHGQVEEFPSPPIESPRSSAKSKFHNLIVGSSIAVGGGIAATFAWRVGHSAASILL